MAQKSTTKRVARGLEGNGTFQVLVRVGYAANGVLHVLIGLLALQIAFGEDAAADQNGALGEIAATPGGVVVLWVIAVGTSALALFELVELSQVRGRRREAWLERTKLVGKAIAYAVVGGLAATVAVSGSAGSGGATSLSAQLLAVPGGVALLLIAALVVAGIGVYLVAKGARQKFLDDLTRPRGRLRTATTVVGSAGYIAKGVAIFVIGGFLAFAAITSDPSQAQGLDGALTALSDLPFGQVLLVIVAVGLVLFGLYCFIRARFAKL
jgi:hypothetical protein